MAVTLFQDAGASTASRTDLSSRIDSPNSLLSAVPSGSADIPNTVPDTAARPPVSSERVRHLLFGSLTGVQREIAHLYALGHANPNDWSRPIGTGRANEVMAILTRRIPGE